MDLKNTLKFSLKLKYKKLKIYQKIVLLNNNNNRLSNNNNNNNLFNNN